MLSAVTPNETILVEFGRFDKTTLQVPVGPVTHPTSGLDPFQRPRTLAPFTRLCRESCTVIFTVADQLFPLLVATPSRLPTWRFGGFTVMAVNARSTGCGFTVTVVERWLLALLSSAKVWVATSV